MLFSLKRPITQQLTSLITLLILEKNNHNVQNPISFQTFQSLKPMRTQANRVVSYLLGELRGMPVPGVNDWLPRLVGVRFL